MDLKPVRGRKNCLKLQFLNIGQNTKSRFSEFLDTAEQKISPFLESLFHGCFVLEEKTCSGDFFGSTYITAVHVKKIVPVKINDTTLFQLLYLFFLIFLMH